MSFPNKTFRIETHSSPRLEGVVDTTPPSDVVLGRAELLRQIAELRELIEPLRLVAAQVSGSMPPPPVADGEAARLQDELDVHQISVAETRRQLAGLYVGAPHALPLDRIAGELEVSVNDCDQATHAVLGAAEAIQAVIDQQLDGPAAETLQQQVTGILEACNFQDITGQRIRRSIEALAYVEKCVSRLVDLWGGFDGIEPIMAEAAAMLALERETEGSFRLVNGPRVLGEGGHVDQAGIDELFD